MFLDEIDEDGELTGSHIRPDDADSSPFWQLYDAVHNYIDNQGIRLLKTFFTLLHFYNSDRQCIMRTVFKVALPPSLRGLLSRN